MDENEVFVPTEESIKDIVRNEVLHAMATTKPPEGKRKVSLVDKKPGGKRSGKQRQSRPANRDLESQRSRSKSATRSSKLGRSKSASRSNKPRSSSKNARGKGTEHVK